MRVGDKVVCVDAAGNTGLKEGEIYIIQEIDNCPCCKTTTISVGLPCIAYRVNCTECHNLYPQLGNERWYRASRFRPIDYNYGHLLASEIEEEINEEQLILK